MRAEILDTHARFEVEPVLREDGTRRPPEHVTVSLRPCWRKPAECLELQLLYVANGVAYYSAQNIAEVVRK